jgi:hypothetical protein
MTGEIHATRYLIRGGRIYDHEGDIHQPGTADLRFASCPICKCLYKAFEASPWDIQYWFSMAAYSPILPPSSLGEALGPLKGLSPADFSALKKAVSGLRSFSLSKDEREAFRGRVSARNVNLTYLLPALSFIYAHISRLVDSGMPYAEAVSSLVEELDKEAKWGEKKDDVKDKLCILLNPDIHQRFRKIRRLQSGFLPNALALQPWLICGLTSETAKTWLSRVIFRLSNFESAQTPAIPKKSVSFFR